MIPLAAALLLAVATPDHGPDRSPDRALVRAHLLHASVLTRMAATGGAPGSMETAASSFDGSGRRSIPVAFALSAVLPGAGQAYNRQWIKAGTAISIEAATVTASVLLRKDGLSAEDDVEAFAHAHWDPGRYAAWLTDYVAYLDETDGYVVTAPLPDIPTGIDFSQPGRWSESERAEVDRFFDQIRAVERQVYHPETEATFSHQLPVHGEQQYYELIGKYYQFAPGWDDYPAWVDDEGYTAAIDPELTGEGGSKPNVSDTFRGYARDHADAQSTLRWASRISMLIVVNHLVAAIDAAVSAKLHNDRLDTSMGLAYDPYGPPRPVARVSVRF